MTKFRPLNKKTISDMKRIKGFGEWLSEGVNYDSGILYHGTGNKFTGFNDKAPIFFVDDLSVARTYGNIIVKAKLNMDNPIELDFAGKSTYYFYDKWYLPSDLANAIRGIARDMEKRYSLDDDLLEYLQSLDFSPLYGDLDGIIMRDISDTGSGMFSTHKPATNYVVFDRDRIKIIK